MSNTFFFLGVLDIAAVALIECLLVEKLLGKRKSREARALTIWIETNEKTNL